MERKKHDDAVAGEIETAHPGYLGSQDIYYAGTLKGVGRIYQQTFIDTYARVIFAKRYTTKTPITSADLLNDKVLPFYDQHQLPLLRVLTDRGTEYCGKAETHDYQLYLAVNDIEHTKTKAKSPQTNGICERFHQNAFGTLLLSQAAVPLMKKHGYGRIVIMSSTLGALTDIVNPDSAYNKIKAPAYRMSKTMLNAITALLAKELRGSNILVNSTCPGWVNTEMGGPEALISPEAAAATPVWLPPLPDGGPTGGFFRERHPIAW